MVTRRIQPPRNPDGSIQSYHQRKQERQLTERAAKRVESDARRQAARELELNPPPAPLPFAERQAQRKAERIGQQEAEAKAAAEAAANAPPQNPYRARAQEIESRHWINAAKKRRRFEHFTKLAEAWDREQVAKEEAAERQAAIDSDPAVQRARDYAAGLVKLAPDEFKTEAAEIQGIAQAGDSQLAWERIRDVEQRIWQQQDKLAAEKLASKTATDAEFQAAAEKAEESRERFEHAQSMVTNE